MSGGGSGHACSCHCHGQSGQLTLWICSTVETLKHLFALAYLGDLVQLKNIRNLAQNASAGKALKEFRKYWSTYSLDTIEFCQFKTTVSLQKIELHAGSESEMCAWNTWLPGVTIAKLAGHASYPELGVLG